MENWQFIERLRHALENLHGVSGVRVNPLARSCTVEYDAGACWG